MPSRNSPRPARDPACRRRAASIMALAIALGGPAAATPSGWMPPAAPMVHGMHPGMMGQGMMGQGMMGHGMMAPDGGMMQGHPGMMPPQAGHGMAGCQGMAMAMHHGHGRPGSEGRGMPRDGRPEAARPRAQVTVVGEGEAGIAPDLATVSLGVMVQAPTAAEAMSQNASRQRAVIDAIRQAGVEGRDIQTSGLGLSAVQDYSREGRPPVVTGYQATNVVTVRVRDLDRLGPLLDTVVGAGANEIQGISFSREDADAAEDMARQRAVESARRKADALAGAAGMRVGRLLTLSEAPFGGEPRPMMRAMDASVAEAAPVERGEVAVRAQVTAVWELAPARMQGGRAGAPQPVGPLEPDSGASGPDMSQPMPLPGDPGPGVAAGNPPVVAPPPEATDPASGSVPPAPPAERAPAAPPEMDAAPAAESPQVAPPAAPVN